MSALLPNTPARFFACFAASLWLVVAVASVSMALGNPTALNAVLGAGIPAVFVTVWAWAFHRQDQRHASRHP